MWSSERAEQIMIVVCSPDDALLERVCEWLAEHGFSPIPTATAAAAARLCRYARPVLLVLDLDLPDDSGSDLLRRRTEADLHNVSVLVLIGGGLDFPTLMRRDPLLAVDDALSKPFALDDLGGRIAAILRRRHSRRDAVVRIGELVLDPPRRKVLVGHREVHLAKKEFSLLRVLAENPTHVFSRDELLAAVWGLRHPAGGTRTLDSHASRLRNKLDPEDRRFVVVSWGVGYRLVDSIDDAGPVRSDAEVDGR